VNAELPRIFAIFAVIIAAVSAVTDARTGKIPNWLTLPVVLIAPIVRGGLTGAWPMALSLLGGLLCAIMPWGLYQMSQHAAIGGGDIKLFAALGTLTGPALGLEIEFASFVLLGAVAITSLTFKGRLWRLLVSTGWIMVNPFLPPRYKRVIASDALTEMRMGPAIFLGAVLAVAVERLGGGKWFT